MHQLEKSKLSVSQLEQRVRALVNAPRKLELLVKDANSWANLCSAMDAIGDCEVGIQAYLLEEYPKSSESAYVIVYGVLQLLFVEQDAVRVLTGVLDRKTDLPPEILEIRDLRNASIGHPTSHDGAGHFIVRATLTRNGFQLSSHWPDGRHEFRTVDLRSLIEKQRAQLADILEALATKMIEEERLHREKFRDEKLADILGSTMGYHLSKVMEATLSQDPENPVLGRTNLEFVADKLEQLSLRLAARGEVVGGHIFEELSYPVSELRAYFAVNGTSSLTAEGARIFGFFVESRVADLQQVAREIDEKYDT